MYIALLCSWEATTYSHPICPLALRQATNQIGFATAALGSRRKHGTWENGKHDQKSGHRKDSKWSFESSTVQNSSTTLFTSKSLANRRSPLPNMNDRRRVWFISISKKTGENCTIRRWALGFLCFSPISEMAMFFNQFPIFGDPSPQDNTAFSLKIIQVRSGKTGPKWIEKSFPTVLTHYTIQSYQNPIYIYIYIKKKKTIKFITLLFIPL